MTDFGRRTGDMKKSDYDSDGDGVVDNSEKLEASTKAQVQDHTPKSHTHTEAQISDLDHDALKIKGVIVNDAAIGDQKVLAYDLGTQRIVYITPAPSGAAINSIQTGETDIYGTTVFSHPVTINAVVVANTLLLFGGVRSGSNDARYGVSRLELTNATTVTAYRGTDLDCHAYATFTVVEFSSGIKSIQSGTITMTDEENTDTINAVDTAKAFVLYLGASANLADLANWVCSLELTNSTTVTCKGTQGNQAAVVGYMVVEFD